MAEAVGIARAARESGLPLTVSATVETDGRLPDGTPLGRFIDSVDDDIMPTRVLARLKNEAENGERRRSSVLKRISERLEDGPQGRDK